ncbi:SPOR domain-containing protein [Rhabdochromatium marinum]|uniref:SPOR domain-containing protein n=1 Tax=Rhabdochromatium marinum TaxID=48729 RepID=UPI0019045274|nr:SPOR domain-containing protein [Rhabdochromatium marinum]MBK1647351.1 hypothetical protein [Rhabdochromatium marinum]
MVRTASRNSPPLRKRDRPQSTGAFWFLVGSLVGAFAVGLAWMNETRRPPQPSAAQTAKPPVPKPVFDFYDSLPQEEVLVPIDESAPRPAPVPPPKPKPEPEPSQPAAEAAPAAKPKPEPEKPTAEPATAATAADNYQLQLGSFRNLADAERRRAELGLLGLSVNIVKAQVGGADTYRLRTTTLDKAAAGALGRKLQSQGVSSMAIKVGPP